MLRHATTRQPRPGLGLCRPALRIGFRIEVPVAVCSRKALAPYRAYVQDPRNGYRSETLFLGSGMEYSVRL